MLMGIEPPPQKVEKNPSSESQVVFEHSLYIDTAHDSTLVRLDPFIPDYIYIYSFSHMCSKHGYQRPASNNH